MTETVNTSETSENFCDTTRRHMPEDNDHIRRRKNPKSRYANRYEVQSLQGM
jgi:hypothetical protein